MKKAVLICFSVNSEKFKSSYERNKFFRYLYGWKQIVRKEEKAYFYERNGILNEIPHLKVDQSSFIIPENCIKKVIDFLKKWEDKVIWKMFKVIIDENTFEGEKWKRKLD